MIRGVIFDLGGVLIEWSNEISYKAISASSGVSIDQVKAGLERDLPQVQMGELSESVWMRGFFESINRDPPREYEQLWADTFKEGARIDVALRDLILRLRVKVRIGALSNIEPTRLEILRLWRVPELVNASVFSCEVGKRKPDHRLALISDSFVYHLAARRLNVEPRECIYVDDNWNCVEGANLSGMNGLHFNLIYDLEENLRKYGILLKNEIG
jgi:HAD superfamily hydrolase (TIGR01509 family)